MENHSIVILEFYMTIIVFARWEFSIWIWAQILTMRFSRIIFCWHIRRSSHWSCSNTLLIYLIRVLIIAMIIHIDIEDACFRYLSVLLKYLNNHDCFWRNQSYTILITIHRIVNFEYILYLISTIKLLYIWKYIITIFMIQTNSSSRNFLYIFFIIKFNWYNSYQIWYI